MGKLDKQAIMDKLQAIATKEPTLLPILSTISDSLDVVSIMQNADLDKDKSVIDWAGGRIILAVQVDPKAFVKLNEVLDLISR